MLEDIRSEIWLKLWGNLTFNPISALSRATLVDICEFPPTRTLAAAMMAEAQAVGTKLGITFRVTIDKRIDGAARVGKHKTSMLQDIEAGREPEIEALVGSVVELGQLSGTPTPHIDSVYALVKLLAASIAAEAQPDSFSVTVWSLTRGMDDALALRAALDEGGYDAAIGGSVTAHRHDDRVRRCRVSCPRDPQVAAVQDGQRQACALDGDVEGCLLILEAADIVRGHGQVVSCLPDFGVPSVGDPQSGGEVAAGVDGVPRTILVAGFRGPIEHDDRPGLVFKLRNVPRPQEPCIRVEVQDRFPSNHSRCGTWSGSNGHHVMGVLATRWG